MHPRPFTAAVVGSSIFALATVASSAVLGRVIDAVVTPRFVEGRVPTTALVAGAGAIFLVGAVKSGAIALRRINAMVTQARVQATLRGAVVDQYLALPLTYHRSKPTGELLAHAGGDAEASTDILAPLPFATGVMVLLVTTSAWLLATDLFLGAIGLVVLPSALGLNVIVTRRLEALGEEAQRRYGDLSAVAYESIDGAMVVKTLGAEDSEVARFAARAEALRDTRTTLASRQATLYSLLDALPSVGILLLLVVGAWRVDRGLLTTGTLIGFVSLLRLVTWPLGMVGWVLGSMPRTVAGWDRVQAVLAEVPPDEHAPHVSALSDPSIALAVEWLHFSYVEGAEVLDGVSFTLPAGITAALVGATGSGKSTLLSVIAGLAPPTSGRVAVHGPVALAFQEPFVFADSVRSNITLGRGVSEAEVVEAASVSRTDEFADELPDGRDTIIGERGATLSGGQRQRLALARALAAHPRLLLLDDATSSVDPAIEGEILAGLRGRLANTTVLMVAQRPSSIALADMILFLDGGRIAAAGPHRELLATVPEYAALVAAYETARGSDEDDREMAEEAAS